jgi:hypothetical protein
VAPDADHSQCKANHRTEDGRGFGIHFEPQAHNQYGRSRQCRGRVYIGAKNSRNAGKENVAYRAAADSGDSSHQNRNEWMYAKIESLAAPATANNPSPAASKTLITQGGT